jgi:hypothetical protein
MASTQPHFSGSNAGKQNARPSADARQKELAEALNKRFAELNKLWEQAEADLRKIPVPEEVSYCYGSQDEHPEDAPGRFDVNYHIGFARVKGSWRICWSVTRDTDPSEEIDWKPITECGLDIRMEAVPHIGKLREAVLEEAEKCLPTLDKAIEELRGTLQSWK